MSCWYVYHHHHHIAVCISYLFSNTRVILLSLDIRDTVKYKEVMKQFGLGPNGGIITSLNLFSTRFDQVMQLLAKREQQHEYVILDTPGQIEVFTWSASGTIVTDTLASIYPTIVIYVMDLPRCSSPVTFMSNMLYACSVLYKTKLPFLIALNKCDQQNANLAKAWMSDFEQFDFALDKDTSYVGNLTRSMSLVLDAFYKDLQTVAVSAATGDGLEQMIDKFDVLRKEYLDVYRPEYERIRQLADQKKQQEQKQDAGEHLDDDNADAEQRSSQPKKHASKKEELIQFASLSHDYDLMMGRDDADDDDEELEELKEDNEKATEDVSEGIDLNLNLLLIYLILNFY